MVEACGRAASARLRGGFGAASSAPRAGWAGVLGSAGGQHVARGVPILGPLEVEREGRPVALGGARQRALLALLLLHANQAVSADRLVEELWGEPTPARAVKRLQVAVTRLRRALDADGADAGAAPLRTASGGYLLAVAPGELDADVFQARVHDGREALAAGEPARAAELLGGALALWRGPALAEVAYEEFAQAEIRRLEELRLSVLEARDGRRPAARPAR